MTSGNFSTILLRGIGIPEYGIVAFRFDQLKEKYSNAGDDTCPTDLLIVDA